MQDLRHGLKPVRSAVRQRLTLAAKLNAPAFRSPGRVLALAMPRGRAPRGRMAIQAFGLFSLAVSLRHEAAALAAAAPPDHPLPSMVQPRSRRAAMARAAAQLTQPSLKAGTTDCLCRLAAPSSGARVDAAEGGTADCRAVGRGHRARRSVLWRQPHELQAARLGREPWQRQLCLVRGLRGAAAVGERLVVRCEPRRARRTRPCGATRAPAGGGARRTVWRRAVWRRAVGVLRCQAACSAALRRWLQSASPAALVCSAQVATCDAQTAARAATHGRGEAATRSVAADALAASPCACVHALPRPTARLGWCGAARSRHVAVPGALACGAARTRRVRRRPLHASAPARVGPHLGEAVAWCLPSVAAAVVLSHRRPRHSPCVPLPRPVRNGRRCPLRPQHRQRRRLGRVAA